MKSKKQIKAIKAKETYHQYGHEARIGLNNQDSVMKEDNYKPLKDPYAEFRIKKRG